MSETCVCGHALDEHDDMGECLMEPCGCFYAEVAEEEGAD